MIGTPIFGAVAMLAFVGCYVALCVYRPAAARVKLLDVAGKLKQHQGAVPLVGGLAILSGYLCALIAFPFLLEANAFFLAAGTLLVVTGTLDDRYVLSPVLRIVVQIVVALTAVFGGSMVVATIGAPFFTGVIELGWLAVPFSILVFVGGINAWNMIDGIDGLASMLAFIGFSCMLAVAAAVEPALQASLLAMLFAVGAFFLFNLPIKGLHKQRTFLGDAGSMFLGLGIVWHALALSQGETAVMSPVTALWFVALPVYDVITTTTRRLLRGHSPFDGDRQHLHHLLQDHGMTPRQTLWIISGLAMICGLFGLASHFARIPDGLTFAVFAAFGAIYFFTIRRLAKSVPKSNANSQDDSCAKAA